MIKSFQFNSRAQANYFAKTYLDYIYRYRTLTSKQHPEIVIIDIDVLNCNLEYIYSLFNGISTEVDSEEAIAVNGFQPSDWC